MSTDGHRRYVLRRTPIAETDVEETARVVNEAFGRYEIMAGDRTSPDGLLEEGGTDAEFIQVFDEHSELLATAMIRPAHGGEDDAFADAQHALYYGLAGVTTASAGDGMGTTLLREAERLARTRGYTSVTLGTLREFNLPSYYERFGYSTVATQDWEAGHWDVSVPHTSHDMQKMLAPAFRSARAEESARVTEIVNAAYRAEDFFINGNRTTESEIAGLIAAGQVLVLEPGDGTIAGAVYVEQHGESGYFGMLSVDPVRQKTGWGRLLVDMVEQRAQDAGLPAMTLHVVNLREELPPWYRRLGYRTTGTLPFPDPWKLKRPAHMVTMTKPLPLASEGREIWL